MRVGVAGEFGLFRHDRNVGQDSRVEEDRYEVTGMFRKAIRVVIVDSVSECVEFPEEKVKYDGTPHAFGNGTLGACICHGAV